MTGPHSGTAGSLPVYFLRRVALGLLTVAGLVLLSAFPASSADEEGAAFKNPHNYDRRDLCEYCHKALSQALTFDTVTTCARCHPGNVGNHPVTRHPVGVVPKIHIPKNLPVTREGMLVCYTCHDPHNRTSNKYMLRVEYFKLCASCHVGY